MFSIGNENGPASKCIFTHSVLPEHIDERHPPTKKKPFATITELPFAHTASADLILPREVHEAVKQQLDGNVGSFQYARVYMTLGEIVEGDFFNDYIKTGNVLMISEGRRGVDNTFSLREGVLRLDLDRPTYERCGLEGKPVRHPGRKHTKERYAVELELRKPSMLHGKKGFERIVWAFKNVLNHSLAWLFHDLNSPREVRGPISTHQPHCFTSSPEATVIPHTKLPALTSIPDLCDAEYGAEVLEWFGMVSLSSPRIDAHDSVDSFLSRYEVPMPYKRDGDADSPAVEAIVRLRWRGLVPAPFLLRLWLTVREEVGERWMALSVAGFRQDVYTMLGIGARDVLAWECK
ncbi:ribonuclease P 40kDa subunit-domain-containing protein [Phyllosticta citricarpa]